MSVTFEDIKDMFRESVNDPVGASFTDTQIVLWCNKALQEMAEMVEYIDEELVFNSSDGNDRYVLFADLRRLRRVELDGQKLIPTTQRDLEKANPRWRQITGKPTRYYTDQLQDVDGEMTVGLYPVPDDIWEMRYIYYGGPEVVSIADETNELQVPEWCAYNVLFSMLADAYEADTSKEDLNVAGLFRVLFDDALKRLRIRSNSRLNKEWSYDSGGRSGDSRAISIFPRSIPAP